VWEDHHVALPRLHPARIQATLLQAARACPLSVTSSFAEMLHTFYKQLYRVRYGAWPRLQPMRIQATLLQAARACPRLSATGYPAEVLRTFHMHIYSVTSKYHMITYMVRYGALPRLHPARIQATLLQAASAYPLSVHAAVGSVRVPCRCSSPGTSRKPTCKQQVRVTPLFFMFTLGERNPTG
jgi:hypothetical protein